MDSSHVPKVKILSWSLAGVKRFHGSMELLLDSLQADIICFQEIKISHAEVDRYFGLVNGYNAYFSLCTTKTGFSGVVTYCKDDVAPLKAEEGLSGLLMSSDSKTAIGYYTGVRQAYSKSYLKCMDKEGRAVMTLHNMHIGNELAQLLVINANSPKEELGKPWNFEVKVAYYKMLEHRALTLLNAGYYVVIVGDLNTPPRLMSPWNVGDMVLFDYNPAHSLLNRVICNFDDAIVHPEDATEENMLEIRNAFKCIHPYNHAVSCWANATEAQGMINGARVDYSLIDLSSVAELINSSFVSDFVGSFHCPIEIVLGGGIEGSARLPDLCSKFYPQLSKSWLDVSDYLRDNPNMRRYNFDYKQINYCRFNEIGFSTTKRVDSFGNGANSEAGPSGLSQSGSGGANSSNSTVKSTDSSADQAKMPETQDDNSTLSDTCSTMDSVFTSTDESQESELLNSIKKPSQTENVSTEEVVEKVEIEPFLYSSSETKAEEDKLDSSESDQPEQGKNIIIPTAPPQNNFSQISFLKSLSKPEQSKVTDSHGYAEDTESVNDEEADDESLETSESERDELDSSYSVDTFEDSTLDYDGEVERHRVTSNPLTQDESANLSWDESRLNPVSLTVEHAPGPLFLGIQGQETTQSSFEIVDQAVPRPEASGNHLSIQGQFQGVFSGSHIPSAAQDHQEQSSMHDVKKRARSFEQAFGSDGQGDSDDSDGRYRFKLDKRDN